MDVLHLGIMNKIADLKVSGRQVPFQDLPASGALFPEDQPLPEKILKLLFPSGKGMSGSTDRDVPLPAEQLRIKLL